VDAIKKFTFELPCPLSVNAIYKFAVKNRYGGRLPFPHLYMTPEAKDLKEEMALIIRNQALTQGMSKFKDTYIIAEVIPYNLRANADTNNLHKLLWDAFQYSGYIDDDKHIIERTPRRLKTPDKVRKVSVTLYEPKGQPSQEDIKTYFWWCDAENLKLELDNEEDK
jgi:Holliday junction resolvase RusA-like endonuclease